MNVVYLLYLKSEFCPFVTFGNIGPAVPREISRMRKGPDAYEFSHSSELEPRYSKISTGMNAGWLEKAKWMRIVNLCVYVCNLLNKKKVEDDSVYVLRLKSGWKRPSVGLQINSSKTSIWCYSEALTSIVALPLPKMCFRRHPVHIPIIHVSARGIYTYIHSCVFVCIHDGNHCANLRVNIFSERCV